MATTGGARAPIKSGTGYIDIHPRLNAGAMSTMRKSLLSEMASVGAAAGKELSTSMSRAATAASKTAAAASKSAQRSVRADAQETRAHLQRIETALTDSYGRQAAQRFRTHQRTEVARRRVTEGTTAATRAALQQTLRDEEAASRTAAQRWQRAERSRIQMIRERQRAERQAAAERTRQLREQQAAEMALLRRMRQARANDLRTQLQDTGVRRRELQRQLEEHRRVLNGMQRTQLQTWKVFERNWRRSTQHLSHLGEQASETGNLVTTHLLAPLTGVSGALTAIGVKSADSFKVLELGLRGMKLQMADINRLQKNMQDYAVATPYSLEEMQEYSTRFARMFSSHNDDLKSNRADRRARGSRKVASQTEQIIKAVGDNAAASGILDPDKVSRALNALAIMGDQDRVNMRYLKQFEQATGMPAEEVASLMGFKPGKKHKTAAAAMFAAMQDPKKSGGVSGVELINKVIKNWQKRGFEDDSPAAKLSQGTISGRIQALQEKTKLGLGRLFIDPGEDGKPSKYTDLGERVMGKGGIIDQFEAAAKGAAPFAGETLKTFFDVIETFTGWLKGLISWLGDHDGIREALLQAAKIAAVATPFLLGFGLLAKVVGKLGKTLGLLLTPAKFLVSSLGGLARGVRGAGRTARQVGSGARSARSGGGFLSGYDGQRDAYRTRDEARRRGRERFRRASRENGRVRTAAGYSRYGLQRVTGYSGLGDWRRRRRNFRADYRDADSRARAASRSGQYGEAVRLHRRSREIHEEYRDNRRQGRRNAAAASRPTDSIDRQEQSRRAIRDLEAALRQTDDRAEQLRRQLRQVNSTDLGQLRNQLGGSTSVQSAASQAQRAVRSIQTQGITPLNTASTSELARNLGQLDQEADKLRKAFRDTSLEVGKLNERKLGSLRQQQLVTTKNQADSLKKSLEAAGRAVTGLDSKSMKAVRGEISSTSPKVDALKKRLGEASAKVATLNRRSLTSLRTQVSKLGSEVDKVRGKVGTAKATSSLSGRISSLNGRKLGSVIKQVRSLRGALSSAARKADDLDTAIDRVNSSTSSGSRSTTKKKRRRYAAGGVLPGYRPGVDSIPALLSPGEAILRPEVAASIGPDVIDTWNGAAVRGRLSRYARGTSAAGRALGLESIKKGIGLFDLSEIVRLFSATTAFDASAAKLGRRTPGLVPWGAQTGGGRAGSGAASKFRGLVDWATEGIPDLLKRIPSGAGQLLGIAAGAIAPSAGRYFWDDIWKGEGNILQRGGRFLGHMLDPENVLSMIKDALGGAVETVKALGSFGKDLITDPGKALSGVIDDLREIFTGMVDAVTNTVQGLIEIYRDPSAFANQVWEEFWARAKEAAPNTEGLFKFANGGVVPGYRPDDDRVQALLSPGEAVLRPEAVRRLGYQTIMDLNRGARTGRKRKHQDGEVIPSPDSAAFAAEVQKIQQSLAVAGQAIQQSKNSNDSAWTAISAKVKSSVDGSIKPSLNGWSQALMGPTTSATKGFQRTNSSSMTAISEKIRSTKNSANDSFSKMRSGMKATESSFRSGQKDTAQSFDRMKSGLKSLEKSFSNSQKHINQSFGKVPIGVTKAVRKAIDFIQRAMIRPVNEKLLGPAKIGKIANLPQFATGGVVPGYSPGSDSVLAMLSPGESILRPEVTRALGEETIHALNGAAMKGQLPAFATGGIIGDWKKAENSVPGDFTSTAEPIINRSLRSFLSGAKKLAWLGGVIEAGAEKAKDGVLGQLAIKDAEFGVGGANTAAALRWARTQAGKPYQWGGNGDPSWDCSGFMSAIESVIRGEKPHRRWATGAFHGTKGPAGWVRDLKSPFMIGITNAGVGHTAGTLNGVNVESRGGDGVVVGKKARGYKDSLFTSRWGFKPAIDTGGKGSGAGRWSETVSAVLRELGLYSPTNLANVLKAIAKESGGNPKAVNNWDSNAAKGQASRGLLQTIPSTFAAYAGKYRSRGITDPYANIYAAVRYAKSRYGAGWAARMARPGGYWTGTISASPGLALVGEHGPELVSFKGGERVRNRRQTEEILSARPAPIINVYEAKHEDSAQAVIRGLQMWEAVHATRM